MMAPLISMISQLEVPFFSNDAVGVIKVVVTIVAPISVTIIFGYLKILKGDWKNELRSFQDSLSKKIDKITGDIDGLGTRVGRVELTSSTLDTKGDEMSKQVDRHELELVAMKAGITELHTGMKEIDKTIRESTKEITAKIHESDKKLYVFERYMDQQQRLLHPPGDHKS